MSKRVHQFDSAIRRLIVSSLADLNFTTNYRRRVFRRTAEDHGCQFVQIISFQVGSKSLSGHFTVNLGVYCPEVTKFEPGKGPVPAFEVCDCLPEMTKRLGFLFVPQQSFLSRTLRLNRPEPFDYWWSLDEDGNAMERNVIQVQDCLLNNGIPWLNQTATSERLQWAKRQVDERRHQLEIHLPKH